MVIISTEGGRNDLRLETVLIPMVIVRPYVSRTVGCSLGLQFFCSNRKAGFTKFNASRNHRFKCGLRLKIFCVPMDPKWTLFVCYECCS